MRGKDKEALAKKLGASIYIDSQTNILSVDLQKLGGAKVILRRVTASDAMKAVLGGLSIDARSSHRRPFPLSKSIPSNFLSTARPSEAGTPALPSTRRTLLAFSVLSGVRSMNESFRSIASPKLRPQRESGKAHFRVVPEHRRS